MKTISIFSLFASLTLLLAGCGSPPPLPTQTEFGQKSVEHFPPLNTQSTAEIGQNIVSSSSVVRTRSVVIGSDISEKVVDPVTATVRAGTVPLFLSNELGQFFRDSNATFKWLGETVTTDRVGIFVPHDGKSSGVIYHFTSKFNLGKTPVPVVFSISEKWTKDSFKKELVYTGISQNTISIVYREFIDNIARPAFSQELKYDLSQGASIGYKGARFEIVKATNTELIYKVIKALD